jgi:hypothetical protein
MSCFVFLIFSRAWLSAASRVDREYLHVQSFRRTVCHGERIFSLRDRKRGRFHLRRAKFLSKYRAESDLC